MAEKLYVTKSKKRENNLTKTSSRSSLESADTSKAEARRPLDSRRRTPDIPKLPKRFAGDEKRKASHGRLTSRTNLVAKNKGTYMATGSSSGIGSEKRTKLLTWQQTTANDKSPMHRDGVFACPNCKHLFEVGHVIEVKKRNGKSAALSVSSTEIKPKRKVSVPRPPWNNEWTINKTTTKVLNNDLDHGENDPVRGKSLSSRPTKTYCKAKPTPNGSDKKGEVRVRHPMSQSVSDIYQNNSKARNSLSTNQAPTNNCPTPKRNRSASLGRKSAEMSILNPPSTSKTAQTKGQSPQASIHSTLEKKSNKSVISKKQSLLRTQASGRTSGSTSKTSITSEGSFSRSSQGSVRCKAVSSIPTDDIDSVSKLERLYRGFSTVVRTCDRKKSSSKTSLCTRAGKNRVMNRQNNRDILNKTTGCSNTKVNGTKQSDSPTSKISRPTELNNTRDGKVKRQNSLSRSPVVVLKQERKCDSHTIVPHSTPTKQVPDKNKVFGNSRSISPAPDKGTVATSQKITSLLPATGRFQLHLDAESNVKLDDIKTIDVSRNPIQEGGYFSTVTKKGNVSALNSHESDVAQYEKGMKLEEDFLSNFLKKEVASAQISGRRIPGRTRQSACDSREIVQPRWNY